MNQRLKKIFDLAKIIYDNTDHHYRFQNKTFEVFKEYKSNEMYVTGGTHHMPELNEIITDKHADKKNSSFRLFANGKIDLYWTSYDYHKNDETDYLCGTTEATDEFLEKVNIEKGLLKNILEIAKRDLEEEYKRQRQEEEKIKIRNHALKMISGKMNLTLVEAEELFGIKG